MNKIWNMINGIKGRKYSATVKHLSVNNNLITDKRDIANTLAEQLAYNSSSNQCSVGTRGFKSRMCPPYPHACRKRRLKWGAVI